MRGVDIQEVLKEAEIQLQKATEPSRFANKNKLSPERIFSLESIRKTSINYRLRFLPVHLYKGKIPNDALEKMEQYSQRTHDDNPVLYVMAPADLFILEELDKDPLLFADLGDQKFFLIDKWGGELNAFRKIWAYPLRSFQALLITISSLAALISLAIPSSVMMGPYDNYSGPIRLILFFYLFLSFSGLFALYGFSRMKNFSDKLWHSKYNH